MYEMYRRISCMRARKTRSTRDRNTAKVAKMTFDEILDLTAVVSFSNLITIYLCP